MLAVLGLPVVAMAADARITDLNGMASSGGAALAPGLSVASGASVSTGDESSTVLSLRPGVDVALGSGSVLDLVSNPDAPGGIELNVPMGVITIDASGVDDDNSLSVTAPGIRASVVSESANFTVASDGTESAVVVTSGEVVVTRNGMDELYGPGERLITGNVSTLASTTDSAPRLPMTDVNTVATPPETIQPGGPGNPPVDIPVINPGQGTNTVSPDRPPVTRP